MAARHKPKTIASIAAGLDSRMSANAAATDAIAVAFERTSLALLSLISLGARVASSCAALKRRVAALEKAPERIDETGNNEACR